MNKVKYMKTIASGAIFIMQSFFKSASVLIILFCSSYLSYSHAEPLVTVDDFLGNGWLDGHYAWISQEAQKNTALCNSTVGCTVTICAMGTGDNGYPITCNTGDFHAPYVHVLLGATAKDMHEAFTKKNGPLGIFRFNIGSNIGSGKACIGMIYISKNRVGQTYLMPGSNCVQRYGSQECDVGIMENIQYGTLQASQLNGSRASGSINILCTLTSNVKISMSGTDVPLGTPNLVAKLSTGGTDLANGKTIKITRNQNTKVLVDSVLQKKGPLTSGDYSGSAVITISYD